MTLNVYKKNGAYEIYFNGRTHVRQTKESIIDLISMLIRAEA